MAAHKARDNHATPSPPDRVITGSCGFQRKMEMFCSYSNGGALSGVLGAQRFEGVERRLETKRVGFPFEE